MVKSYNRNLGLVDLRLESKTVTVVKTVYSSIYRKDTEWEEYISYTYYYSSNVHVIYKKPCPGS